MSEHDKGDGWLIGILAVLALLVIGGLGVVGLGFFRASQMAMQQRDVAEAMRQEAIRQREVAEAARLETEAILERMRNVEDRAVTLENGESAAKIDEQESKEKQP
jgi:hypothetical protein